MFNVRLAGGHLYRKQLITWLSLVVSLMVSFCVVLFPTRCLGWDLGLNWVSFWGISYLLFYLDSMHLPKINPKSNTLTNGNTQMTVIQSDRESELFNWWYINQFIIHMFRLCFHIVHSYVSSQLGFLLAKQLVLSIYFSDTLIQIVTDGISIMFIDSKFITVNYDLKATVWAMLQNKTRLPWVSLRLSAKSAYQ